MEQLVKNSTVINLKQYQTACLTMESNAFYDIFLMMQ